MWEYIAAGAIGGLICTFLSVWMTITLLKPLIGDDFEINKPKIKGENNELRVDQQNIVKKLFNRKNKKDGSTESN